jgi:long-chain acyl-CoA synthetase
MNDISKTGPGLSLREAHERLTAPGGMFETEERLIRGIPVTVWKHVPTTAAELLARARVHGAREFLVWQDHRVSYDGFVRAVAAVADDLAARGVRKGDRVAVAMKNCPQWPVAFMAALLTGAIAVPLNAWWTQGELAYALADSGAALVFADDERRGRLPGATILDVDAIAGPPGAWAALPDARLPPVPLDPEDDATIFYTSGTSGLPKGALGTHRALTTNCFAIPFVHARNALRRGEPAGQLPSRPRVTLLAVPFFHVIGSLSILLPNMAGGGKLVLMPKFDVEDALRLIARERVTVAGGVPAIPLTLLEHKGGHDISSLELISYGGAPCPVTLAARIRDELGAWPGQGWGMTETSATFTSHSAEDYLDHPESCGPALPVGRLKVMMKDGVEAPPGVIGELWAFGPGLVKGYWNRARDTAETLRDGWLRTGDLASLDAEGFCTIHDRVRDLVIRGGENIYCAEVENVLIQHPAVADAALVGLPHPLLGEVPAAMVQARGPVSGEALRDFVGDRLAAFKVPVEVLIQRAPLPRNENGKLLKRELRKLFAS